MKKKYNFDVDIVFPWVDGGDIEWQKEKNKFLDIKYKNDISASNKHYRDWDNLQYLFRSIEKFAPWVHKVYFITNGQKPEWLNLNHEKLVWVNHKDYIPSEFLPTFSSNTIEFFMHRIKGLSEHFVYMNDDIFFLKPVKKSDFFTKDGLPKIVAMERAIGICDFLFENNLMNNNRVISKVFNKKQVKSGNKGKWYSITNPVCTLVNMFYDLTEKGTWMGFYNDHLASPLLKSGIEKCWELFGDDLHKSSLYKFRSIYGISSWIFTDYLLCSGRFYPIKIGRKGHGFQLSDGKYSNIKNCCNAIKKQKYKMTCLNDAAVDNFERTKNVVNNALREILPEKSSFEI